MANKNLTVEEIKKKLDDQNIKYDSKAKKEELLALLEDNEPIKRYEAIQEFKDLQDGGRVYLKGDPFPDPAAKEVSDNRISELLSKDNKQGRPVIKEIKE